MFNAIANPELAGITAVQQRTVVNLNRYIEIQLQLPDNLTHRHVFKTQNAILHGKRIHNKTTAFQKVPETF